MELCTREIRSGPVSFRDVEATQYNLSARDYLQRASGRYHTFVASLRDGRAIEVRDAGGELVPIICAGTEDNRTLCARVDGLGYIGGWRYPHRREPWSALVEAINLRRLYGSVQELPTTHRPKLCPHCGGAL